MSQYHRLNVIFIIDKVNAMRSILDLDGAITQAITLINSQCVQYYCLLEGVGVLKTDFRTPVREQGEYLCVDRGLT